MTEEGRPKTAEEAFVDSILDSTPSTEPQEESRPYFGSFHRRLFGLSASVPVQSPYSTKMPDHSKDSQVVTLQPYKGPLHGRLDQQAVELRKRLSNPKAVMLVMRGRTYSAESVWKVVWLYLRTKFFKRWTKKNFPSLATP